MNSLKILNYLSKSIGNPKIMEKLLELYGLLSNPKIQKIIKENKETKILAIKLNELKVLLN